MNPGALEALLDTMWWKELREVARELHLLQKGSRADLIARLMQLHADPCRSVEVVRAVTACQRRHRDAGIKRRRGGEPKDGVRRDLETAFEAAATEQQQHDDDTLVFSDTVDAVQPTSGEVAAAGEVSETLDAADYQDSGCNDTATSRPLAEVDANVAMGQQVVDGMPAVSLFSPHLIYVPRHLCPWQPSPMKLGS